MMFNDVYNKYISKYLYRSFGFKLPEHRNRYQLNATEARADLRLRRFTCTQAFGKIPEYDWSSEPDSARINKHYETRAERKNKLIAATKAGDTIYTLGKRTGIHYSNIAKLLHQYPQFRWDMYNRGFVWKFFQEYFYRYEL